MSAVGNPIVVNRLGHIRRGVDFTSRLAVLWGQQPPLAIPAIVKIMTAEGHSQVTKNVIVGVLNREGMPRRASPVPRKAAPKPPPKVNPVPPSLFDLVPLPSKPAPPAPPAVREPPRPPPNGRCQFPMWGYGGVPRPAIFCGKKLFRMGSPYCREHHKRCYTTREEIADAG